MTKLFTGIRAMVVALISVAVYRLGKASLNDLPKLSIAIIVLVLALILDINPIWFIISGGIIGIILYKRKIIRVHGKRGGTIMTAYLELVTSFFKIGLFGFGGGYAMLPLIQKEIESHNGLQPSSLWI